MIDMATRKISPHSFPIHIYPAFITNANAIKSAERSRKLFARQFNLL